MNKEVTYSDAKLPVVYDSGISNLHPSSMTVRDCPVSVHHVQGEEEVYEGKLVEDGPVAKCEPDAEAMRRYNTSSFTMADTNYFKHLTRGDPELEFRHQNGLDDYDKKPKKDLGYYRGMLRG